MTEGLEFNIRVRLNLADLVSFSEEQIEAITKGISIVLIANPYDGESASEQQELAR